MWENGGEYLFSPKGNFAYYNRIHPEGDDLKLYGKQEGVVFFNGDVVIPTLVDTNLIGLAGERFADDIPLSLRATYGPVWMALTPMEMITQRTGVKMAKGTVVIGGLGLGWLLRKVCEKPEVERVIVVEISQELLDWYGYRICGRYSKVTDVICDDVYNQIGKHGPWTRYLLDIWPTYEGASQDDDLVPFRRRFKRLLWAWGLD
jgi:hypothetical protein